MGSHGGCVRARAAAGGWVISVRVDAQPLVAVGVLEDSRGA